MRPTCLLAALLFAVAGLPRAAGAQPSAQPLFTDSTTLALTLEGPFRRLSLERASEPELPAALRYIEKDGREIALDVEIRPRGISRLRHCRYPPLRIDFRRSAGAGTVFEGQDRLKLVTHCMPLGSYLDFVAREYQIYRMYNALTDASFRVRWVEIEYIDSEDDRRPYAGPGFLIEEDWAVAGRLGMEAVEVDSVDSGDLDPVATAVMGLFQFMVGNVDWSPLKGPDGEPCCHNGKLIGVPGQSTGRVVLPYDFDQATFVDAEYAVHNQALGLRGYERRYRGLCAVNGEIDRAIARVRAVAEEWRAIIDAEPVSERARRRGTRFLESGYEIIADPKDIERQVLRDCRE